MNYLAIGTMFNGLVANYFAVMYVIAYLIWEDQHHLEFFKGFGKIMIVFYAISAILWLTILI